MSEYAAMKRRLYDAYVLNMKAYGKKPLPYREWSKQVNNVKVNK